MSLSSLQNLCMYSLGPGLSDQVETSLESQITGMKDMTKNQVNQAIYIGTQSQIAKTDGALQNIRIAQEFLSTTLAALETVNNELINASKAILTLLNGVVSSSDKEAAADSILNTMGMIQGPTSRDAQEGSVIKTLRQAGTGQSPFYVLTTTEAAPPTPLAAPPEAPVSDGEEEAGPTTLYLNGTGAIPANTFADRSHITFHGFEEGEATGAIDGATANADVTGTDRSDYVFTVEINGATYASQAVHVLPNQEINLYDASNLDKFVTVKTASSVLGLDVQADASTAFQALFTGSIDTTLTEAEAEAAVTGTFTSSQLTADWGTGGTYENTFVDPTVSPPVFTGVEEGAIRVREATWATASDVTCVVQVGDHVYATEAAITLAGDDEITLYLNGDSANADKKIVLTAATAITGFSDAASTVAAFEAVLDGTYTTTSSGSSSDPVFTPTNASPFIPMDGIDFSAASSTGAVAPGTNTYTGGAPATAAIEITIDGQSYTTASPVDLTGITAAAFVTTDNVQVELLKGGSDANDKVTFTILTGTVISSQETLDRIVAENFTGTYDVPADGSTGPSTPFAFNPGSNFGAGYFTVNYDGKHLTVTDQFGTLVNSYPLDDRQVVDAANTTGEIKVGNIGTIYVDSSYTGGGFNAQLTTTPSDSFDAIVTVSASDGTRSISIPNLADQKILWGANDTVDRNLLISSVEYQQRVKGMIDHAAEVVKDTIQYATNVLSVLNNDEEGQNATMESLHNLQDTVSAVDPVQAANAVFETTQSYLRMIQSMTITAQVIAQESASANQIAQLAVAGI